MATEKVNGDRQHIARETAKEFVKKPIKVKAIRVSPDNLDEVRDFMGGEEKRNIDFGINYAKATVAITTLEGTMKADTGDWIIKEPFANSNRQFYPCKPDIFEATYESAARALEQSEGWVRISLDSLPPIDEQINVVCMLDTFPRAEVVSLNHQNIHAMMEGLKAGRCEVWTHWKHVEPLPALPSPPKSEETANG